MKVVIGEYGKVIALVLLLCSAVLFLFGKGENGFLGMLGRTAPEGNVGDEDAFNIAEAIASRKAPELSVRVRKLQKGLEYNLLDAELFEIKAENEEGNPVELRITKIVTPQNEDVTDMTVPEHFTPAYSGEYQITYQAFEVYQGSKKVREKEYRFIAD